jgi:hypothetical protein
MAYLVRIETAGNQAYIFASNRLRENVGASELIVRIGTEFVVQAVADAVEAASGKTSRYRPLASRLAKSDESLTPAEFAQALIGIAEDAPLDTDGAEIVVATSGKALLLVTKHELGKIIVRSVTKRALTDAPGAVVHGVVSSKQIDFAAKAVQAHAVVTEVHRTIEQVRLHLPPPEARFPMLPILRPCRSSGLPASGYYSEDGQKHPIAHPFEKKRKNWGRGVDRMKVAIGGEDGKKLASSITVLEKMDVDWLGVVHADGNGFGALFNDFADVSGEVGARGYFDAYRKFSLSLQLCGVAAFHTALMKAKERIAARSTDSKNKDKLPIVPLVLGGDDLTVICDGRDAIDFAADYLRAFETATGERNFDGITSDIHEIMKRRGTQLGACAGVAIVKPHFPFHRAYELAAKLLRSAKRMKRILAREVDGRICNSVSALDFQTVYEDAAADLTVLRQRWEIGERTRLGCGRTWCHRANAWNKPRGQQALTHKLGPSIVISLEHQKEPASWTPSTRWSGSTAAGVGTSPVCRAASNMRCARRCSADRKRPTHG